VYARAANFTGTETRLFEIETGPLQVTPLAWTLDGLSLLVTLLQPDRRKDLMMLATAGGGKPAPAVQTTADEQYGQISPDGKWLAYVSGETGLTEVYVQPFGS